MTHAERARIVEQFGEWAIARRFPRTVPLFVQWLETTTEGQEVVRKMAAVLPLTTEEIET